MPVGKAVAVDLMKPARAPNRAAEDPLKVAGPGGLLG